MLPKWIQYIQFLVLIVFVIAAILFFHEGRPETLADSYRDFNSNWTSTAGSDSTDWDQLPMQIDSQGTGTVSLSTTLAHGITTNDSVGFFTSFQVVEVYLDTQLIYEFKPPAGSMSKSPAKAWNFISLKDFYGGMELTIVLTDVYSDENVEIPQFFYGSEDAMVLDFVKEQMPGFLISFVMLLIGLASFLYWFFAKKRAALNEAIPRLGLFALALGIWSMMETQLPTLFFGLPLLMNQIAFLSNKIMIISVLQFYASIYDLGKSKILRILTWALVAEFFVSLLLQLFGVLDFMESSIANTVIAMAALVYLAWVTLHMLISSMKSSKEARRIMLIHIGCLVVVGVFNIINTIRAYMPNVVDAATYARIGTLVYLIGMSILVLDDSIRLMKEGREAQAIKLEAQTDTLTRLKNRSAFESDMHDIPSMEMRRYGMVMCDLNNLKLFNDLHGHSMGDYYISTCANIIQEVYGGYGTAYRMGGDEFVVLVKDLEIDAADQLRIQLEAKAETASAQKKNLDLHMAIAAGYAKFDPATDKNLVDTKERADQVMYVVKSGMKHRGHND